MKISFEDAALNLERLYKEASNAEERDAGLQALFDEAEQQLELEVDRRIRHAKYAKSQMLAAEKEMKRWQNRARHFKKTGDWLKKNTLAFLKGSSNPDIRYKGSLGELTVVRNSNPSLCVDHSIIFENESYVLEVRQLDIDLIRSDLLEGKTVEGATLEYGEHVRGL